MKETELGHIRRQIFYQVNRVNLIHRVGALLTDKKQHKMKENLKVGIDPFSFAQHG